MPAFLWSIIAFVVAIGILVSFHEYGHFQVARWLNVKVLRFSIGFGKPLLTYKSKKGIEYVLAMIPLGGYVKMLDENEAEVAEEEKHLAFNRQKVWKRILIVIAGPLFNFIFAIFAYWLMFSIGITSIAPIIGKVIPQSIAAKAGLKNADEFTAIGKAKVTDWHQANLEFAAHLGSKRPLPITVENVQTKAVRHLKMDLTHWQINQKQHILTSLGLTPYFPKPKAIIGEVIKGSPAAIAGIKSGDKIISMDGQSVKDWGTLIKISNKNKGKLIAIHVLRNKQVIKLKIKPSIKKLKNNEEKAELGVISAPRVLPSSMIRKHQFPIWSAWIPAFKKTGHMTKLTFAFIWKMITGAVSVKGIAGPVGIAQGAGLTLQMGFTHYLDFLALISISLAVINILPIPILDGGHLLYYIIEIIQRKPVSQKTQIIGFKIGVFLLLALMTVAFYNDFVRLFL